MATGILSDFFNIDKLVKSVGFRHSGGHQNPEMMVVLDPGVRRDDAKQRIVNFYNSINSGAKPK